MNNEDCRKDKIPVACRLCGEITLFPKPHNIKDLIGYECPTCRRKYEWWKNNE